MADMTPEQEAWMAARKAEHAHSVRVSSAIRDRPPLGDPRYDAYQQDVMGPLSEEWHRLRREVEAARQAMNAAKP